MLQSNAEQFRLFGSYEDSFTPRFTFFAGTALLSRDGSPFPDPVRQDTVELVRKNELKV